MQLIKRRGHLSVICEVDSMLRKIRNAAHNPRQYARYAANVINGWRITNNLKDWWVKWHIEHVFGPQHIQCPPDGCIVVCIVRNGEEYIKAFIKHYLSLNVDHIVFLDNGSTDQTLDIARRYARVTILRTRLP